MAHGGWTPPGRLRRLLSDLPAVVAYGNVVALPVFLGLGWLSRQDDLFVLSVLLTAVVFVVLGAVVFLGLAYEEDWWDDFREQNRALILFLLLHLLGLPAGWFLGRSLGGWWPLADPATTVWTVGGRQPHGRSRRAAAPALGEAAADVSCLPPCCRYAAVQQEVEAAPDC